MFHFTPWLIIGKTPHKGRITLFSSNKKIVVLSTHASILDMMCNTSTSEIRNRHRKTFQKMYSITQQSKSDIAGKLMPPKLTSNGC